MQNNFTIQDDELASRIQSLVAQLRADSSPEQLDKIKKLVRKNVPFSLRGYFSAYLLRELIRMIIKEDLTGSDRDEAGLDQSERLFTHLVRRMLKPAAENTIVRSRSAQLADLWNKVSQHLENVWTVDDLCSIMNCSRSHLTRLCQEYYKQSPGEKVRAMKMEYAKILLSSSTSTIHEIAESVGFSRASLFSSSFAAYEGMSPREYRQASQGS